MRTPVRSLVGFLGIALTLGRAVPAFGQTYTSAASGNFTNIQQWNFGVGPIPSSNPTGAIALQSFGTSSYTASNDLNLTLQTLRLNAFSSGTIAVASTLSGNLAFTGSGQIQQLGSGGATTLSVPIALGATATGLSFTGAGLSNTTVSGIISSNMAAGAPLTIGLTTAVPNVGIVTLSGANTFGGGVVLNGGNLALGNALNGGLGVFGNTINSLTVNGGSLQGGQTVLGNVILNSNLTITGGATATTFGAAGGLGLGVLSGIGGVNVQPAGTGQQQVFNVANTYTGATNIGQVGYAPTASPDNPGGLRLNSAVGSILNTSAINVRDGGQFEINYNGGNSINNARVSAATPISITSGFFQLVNSNGVVSQALGTLTAAGHVTVLANAAAANASTTATFANVVRSGNSTVAFSGNNLGNAATGPGVQQGNIFLTQINGAAPAAALVGGGGAAGTSTISIIPWALGDAANTGTNFAAGTGFVTYDVNGVRLLNAATEYNTTGDFTTATPTQNMRVNAITNPTANTTVNSVFVATTGLTLAGGANVLTITSGALASNVAAFTTSSPIAFGAGGTGEAIVSTIIGFGGVNTITANDALTGSTLTKTGHGTLVLGSTTNAFSSNAITVNGGFLSVAAIANLGIANSGASSMTFNMHSFLNRGGLLYSGTVADTLSIPIRSNAGHMQLGITGAAGALTVTAPIVGAGGVNYNSTGAGSVLALNADNTYTGGTRLGGGAGTYVIQGGTNADLVFGNPSGFIAISAAATTTRLAANWNTTRNITFEAAWGTAATTDGFDTAGFNSSWGGPIVGASNIIKVDSGATQGTWSITGANNSYTGTIILGNNATTARPGGTLALVGVGDLNSASVTFGPAAAGAAGTYALDLSAATGPGTVPWRSFANINTGAGFTQAHQISLGASAAAPVDIRIGAGSFGGTAGGTAGVIQGFGTLVKTGTGTLTLATPNTFTGGVEVWGGTLSFSNDNQLGTATNAVSLQGGILSMGTGTYARNINLAPTPVPVLVAPANGFDNAQAVTLTGNITGPGGFNKTGTGTLTLSGINTYGTGTPTPSGTGVFSGNTRIAVGTIAITSDANLGSATSQLIFAGGTLQLLSGSATLARPIMSPGAGTFDVQGTSLQIDGTIIGQNGLTKVGPGTLVINSSNPNYNNTTITVGGATAGTGNLTFTATGSIPRTTITMVATGTGTLDMSGLSKEVGTLNLNTGTTLALGTGGTLNTGFVNGAHTIAGNVTGDATAVINKYGTGAIAWTSAGSTFGGGLNIYFGATTVSGTGVVPALGSLTVGGLVDLNTNGTSLILDNGTTGLDNRIADTQVLTVNNAQLTFTTNATTANTENIDSLRASGLAVVTMTTGGTLNFTNAVTGFTRVNRAALFVRGGGGTAPNPLLGSGPGSTTAGVVSFANLGAGNLLGGGGAAGTTTVSILPFAFSADTGSAASTGNTFVTIGANGIRPLVTTTEFATTFTGSTADTNVRTGTPTTFTGADGLANSLLIPGTANTAVFNSAAAERLIVSSGVIGNTVTQVYGTAITAAGPTGFAAGIQVAELQTGAGNTRELIVHNMSANLNIGALISTSGGLTKSGAGELYLTNPANTYTGGTTINGAGVLGAAATSGQLVIDGLGSVNNFAGGLTIAGGFLKYRGAPTALPGTLVVTMGGGSANSPGGGGGFNIVSGTSLSVAAGQLTGFGGLNKEGTGVLTISGAQTYSGPTVLHAGAIAIDNAGSLGTHPYVFVNTSNPGAATSGAVIRFNAPMTLAKNFDGFTGSATVGFGFDTNGNNVTLSGTIASTISTRGVYKFGAGDLTLTAANGYIGATQVFGGNLIFGGANGSALASTGAAGFNTAASFAALPGGTLVLDNSVVNNNNRLPDQFTDPIGTADSPTATGIRLIGGGLTIRGNAAVPTAEVTNRFEIGLGGVVTLENNGQNVSLITGRMNRADSSSLLLIRGNNLGATPSAISTNWFSIDLGSGSTQSAGAGGAAGTPFVSIIPGTFGDTSPAGNGTDLVTYDSRVGFRPLAATEYATAFAPTNFDNSRAPIIGATGATPAPAVTSWVSAIRLGAGASITGSATIDLRASSVLATGTSSIDVPSMSSNGNAGYDIWTAGAGTTLTINANLNSGKLYKGGAGTLALAGAYYGTGAVYVNQGTLQLSGPNASLTPIGSAVTVSAGATFDLGGQNRTIGALTTTALAGSFNFNQVADGTVLLGSSRLTLYDNANSQFSGQFVGTSASNITVSLFSNFPQLYQPQPSFFGSIRAFNGTLTLGGAGSVLNAARMDLLGGNLLLNNADDNAYASGYVAQRVSPTMPINLAGIIQFTANANAVANHQFGAIALVGEGVLNTTPGASASTTITIANLTRAANRGTLNLAGTTPNLGLLQSPVGNARIFATQIDGAAPATALIGGGGAGGTTTVSILPWAFSTSNGSFVTYGPNGFRALNTATGTGAEYNASLTAAGPTENVLTTAAATLIANTEVNSLLQTTAGGVAGAFNLTVASGALATTIGGTIGNAGNTLLTGTGGSNDRELLVFNSSATALTLSSNVTTTGGLTKHGSGPLTLTGTNTFGGGLAIQGGTVSFTADTQLGAPGGGIAFGLRTNAVSPTGSGLQYTGTTLLELNRPVTTNSYASFRAPAAVPLVFNQPITGEGSVGFDTAGSIYEFNGVNTYRGDLFVNQGLFSIRNDTGFGDPQSTLQMFQSSTTEGVFLRGNWATTRPIHNRLGWALNTNGFDATFNGIVFGASAITKNGLGNLTITTPNPYSATTTINAGTVRLVGRGAVNGGAGIGFGAALILDDTVSHHSDRMPDGAAISNNNGELALLGNGGVLTEEVVGSMTLGIASTVTIVPGGGQAAILRLGQTGVLTRGAASSILFRGTNLGANAPGTPNTASFLVFNPVGSGAALSGGGGAPGSTAVSVIAGAFGDTSATGQGTQLVTYDLTNGIRLLTASEFATDPAALNGRVISDNVRLTTSTALANATTVNALWLDNGGGTTGAGLVSVAAGNILVTGAGNTIANGLSTGANALAFGGPGDVTVNGVIPTGALGTGTTGGLIKRGTGTLTLNGANTYTGNTTLAAGTTVIGNNTAFGATAGTLRFLGGTLQAGAAGLTVANPIGLSGDMIVTGSNSVAFTGAVTLESATRGITVGSGISVTLGGVISGTAAIAGVGLTKNGPGLLILTGANAYASGTTYGFYESQTTVNAGELRVSNTAGSGTGGSRVVVNSGGTLSGTGTILPTQGNVARNTLTVNSGGTLSPGASVGTLTVGSVATPATVNLTAGSNYAFEYAAAPVSAAANTGGSGASDNIVVNGALNLDALINFQIIGTFADFTASQPYSYTVATQTAAFAPAINITDPARFNTTQFAGFVAFQSVSLASSGNVVYFNFTPVPEPTTVLATCALAAAGLGVWRKRRPRLN